MCSCTTFFSNIDVFPLCIDCNELDFLRMSHYLTALANPDLIRFDLKFNKAQLRSKETRPACPRSVVATEGFNFFRPITIIRWGDDKDKDRQLAQGGYSWLPDKHFYKLVEVAELKRQFWFPLAHHQWCKLWVWLRRREVSPLEFTTPQNHHWPLSGSTLTLPTGR